MPSLDPQKHSTAYFSLLGVSLVLVSVHVSVGAHCVNRGGGGVALTLILKFRVI